MSRRYPRPVLDLDAGSRTPPVQGTPMVARLDDTTEDPMKIQFTSVQLHEAAPRLDAGLGQAIQDTSFFDVARARVTIELDTASGIVTISKGTACHNIPVGGVKRFGPTLEQAAKHTEAMAAQAEATRLANAKAEREAAALAARPAAVPVPESTSVG